MFCSLAESKWNLIFLSLPFTIRTYLRFDFDENDNERKNGSFYFLIILFFLCYFHLFDSANRKILTRSIQNGKSIVFVSRQKCFHCSFFVFLLFILIFYSSVVWGGRKSIEFRRANIKWCVTYMKCFCWRVHRNGNQYSTQPEIMLANNMSNNIPFVSFIL